MIKGTEYEAHKFTKKSNNVLNMHLHLQIQTVDQVGTFPKSFEFFLKEIPATLATTNITSHFSFSQPHLH